MPGLQSLQHLQQGKIEKIFPLLKKTGKIPKSMILNTLLNGLFGENNDQIPLNSQTLSKAGYNLSWAYQHSNKALFSENVSKWWKGYFILIFLLFLYSFSIVFSLVMLLLGGFFIFLCWIFPSPARAGKQTRQKLLKSILPRYIPVMLISIPTLLAFSFFAFSFLSFVDDSIVTLSLFVVSALMLFVSLIFKDLMTVRSKDGVKLLADIQGLRMYLETAEKHRLEATKEATKTGGGFNMDPLAPYAFALDIARTRADEVSRTLLLLDIISQAMEAVKTKWTLLKPKDL